MECSSTTMIMIALYLFKCVIVCSIANIFKDLLHCYYALAQLPRAILSYLCRDDTITDTDTGDMIMITSTLPPSSSCSSEELSVDDARLVVRNLGMVDWSGEEEGWRELEGARELLEEKEASEEEVKEAFYVFDRDEDGFIGPAELWSVMRRLGMKEGARMEDCERMIGAFDEGGDGRIGFIEFKRLLENAM